MQAYSIYIVKFTTAFLIALKGKRDKLEEHYKSQMHRHLDLACYKVRENESRTVCTNGVFIWKIDNYRKKMDESSESDEELAIFSPPFYTSQYGYKLKLKAYLNGRDRGRGKHLSLYIIIMKGAYDTLLDWPYNMKVTFYLLDQLGRRTLALAIHVLFHKRFWNPGRLYRKILYLSKLPLVCHPT